MRIFSTIRKTSGSLLLLVLSLPLSAQNSPYIRAVDEYVPAPGQFVNSLPELSASDTPETAAAKCTSEIGGKEGIVTLGGYGGYITFHFDHPVVNVQGAYDLYIKGNAHEGSSEPGIVMVSQDENGNGLPDDTWYELSGSADTDSIGRVDYDYTITYTKSDLQDVPWTDSRGNSGVVARNEYHNQEYFPLWLPSPLIFHGTRLPDNGFDRSGKGIYWVQNTFAYGYVDNVADSIGSCFNIGHAVDRHRQSVHLPSIDFVRVYSAVNQQCGWIGETSTEICGAVDLHPTATLIGPVSASPARLLRIFSLDGRTLQHVRRGVNILQYTDGTIKKIHIK